MRIKVLISVILFYFLALTQTSFLVHFTVWGIVPNLVLGLVILWNIFENSRDNFGLYNAVIGGFFLDVFSNRFIGFNILILVILAILIKIFFRRYVRIPFIEKN